MGYSQMTTFLASSRGGRGSRGSRGKGGKRGSDREKTDDGKKQKTDHVTAVATNDLAEKKKRKCYYCKEEGHFIATCPKLADKSGNVTGSAVVDPDEDSGYNLMSAVSLEQLLVNANFIDRLDEYDAMLDSGANKSIWKSMHILRNVKKGERISTQGVNGKFTTDTFGQLEGFFDIYGSEDAVANILSLAECEDRFHRIDYRKGKWYRVYVRDDYYIEFRRRYGIYIGNLREYLT